MSELFDAATGAVLSPFFGGGTKRMTRPGFLEMTDVQIMPPLLHMIFGEMGAVLPMRLERVTATTITVDLLTQQVSVGEIHLLMSPHDTSGLVATRDDVDAAVRRLHELSGPSEELAVQPDPASGAAATVPALSDPEDAPVAGSRRWLGPLTAFLNLTSSLLLPRIHMTRLYMHQAHIRRGVPARPFAIEATLAEVLLLWMCIAYPGAGATPDFDVVPAAPPPFWLMAPVTG
jgi:hypothetical protein